ncbi:hypothetical protein [Gluconobacter oxydans]|uniref:hypothetical protein n=1 Tax=Gluconobacter oxydans TaxID=442 RepID=UPI00078566A7|nr:hypothetical protein [Gluconobacter oxydans]KXV13941.1 hypothetical protein AD932_03375 [Gluconobacter oxydans]
MATTQIDLCNMALRRLGTQSTITALTDGSVEADTCSAFYDQVLNSLLANPQCSAYPNYSWQWPRAVASGTGAKSTFPRWKYEYALPEDCITVCELFPTNAPPCSRTQDRLFGRFIDYQEGQGFAGGTAAVPVIWCDIPSASVVYITGAVDIAYWPPAFTRAFWLSLAAEMATSLGIDGNTTSAVMAEADRAVSQACQADQRVEVLSTDYVPDWMAVRGYPFGHRHEHIEQSLSTYPSGFIVGDASATSPTPAYLTPANTLNGVASTGLQPRDIGDRLNQYIPADTPDGRIGVLSIGASPIGWRRPYHKTIILGDEPGEGETEL